MEAIFIALCSQLHGLWDGMLHHTSIQALEHLKLLYSGPLAPEAQQARLESLGEVSAELALVCELVLQTLSRPGQAKAAATATPTEAGLQAAAWIHDQVLSMGPQHPCCTSPSSDRPSATAPSPTQLLRNLCSSSVAQAHMARDMCAAALLLSVEPSSCLQLLALGTATGFAPLAQAARACALRHMFARTPAPTAAAAPGAAEMAPAQAGPAPAAALGAAAAGDAQAQAEAQPGAAPQPQQQPAGAGDAGPALGPSVAGLPGLAFLSAEDLAGLLSDDGLAVPSERHVLLALLEWANACTAGSTTGTAAAAAPAPQAAVPAGVAAPAPAAPLPPLQQQPAEVAAAAQPQQQQQQGAAPGVGPAAQRRAAAAAANPRLAAMPGLAARCVRWGLLSLEDLDCLDRTPRVAACEVAIALVAGAYVGHIMGTLPPASSRPRESSKGHASAGGHASAPVLAAAGAVADAGSMWRCALLGADIQQQQALQLLQSQSQQQQQQCPGKAQGGKRAALAASAWPVTASKRVRADVAAVTDQAAAVVAAGAGMVGKMVLNSAATDVGQLGGGSWSFAGVHWEEEDLSLLEMLA